MRIDWMTAFLDTPAAPAPAAEAFWAIVTGTALSTRRGERDEFATLLPPDGDAYVRVQTIGAGPAGVHLDLWSDELWRGELWSGELWSGELATTDRRPELDPEFVVRTSPGGFVFCVQPSPASPLTRPSPARFGVSESRLDQLCLDIPAELFDAEVRFWADLTGWPAHLGARPEFHYLERPDGAPLRILFQRLDSPHVGSPAVSRVTAHLDIACSDRPAEVERHLELGARIVRVTDLWTTLEDLAGRPYCLTDRDPTTGRLHRRAGETT